MGARESAAAGGGSFREQCSPSLRADGEHSWKFDGDDPWIECHYCHEVRDALTGFVARPASESGDGR